MLRKMKDLKGFSIGARDGDIGEANDFIFDDKKWTVSVFGRGHPTLVARTQGVDFAHRRRSGGLGGKTTAGVTDARTGKK